MTLIFYYHIPFLSSNSCFSLDNPLAWPVYSVLKTLADEWGERLSRSSGFLRLTVKF